MLHGEQVWIQDLSSLNGTFVNGRRVISGHPLHNGDLINICFHLFRINIRRPAPFTAPQRDGQPQEMHIARYEEVVKP
jgi:pSer/pThr/pTyr-binding forkhead associated (FHA) protein